MNKTLFKKALPKGLLIGIAIAMVLILARTFISGTSFVSNLASLYGALTLICLPVFFVWYEYSALKRKQKDEEK